MKNMIFDQTYIDPPLTLDEVRARLNATLDSIGPNAKMRFHASCGDDRGIIEISWRYKDCIEINSMKENDE